MKRKILSMLFVAALVMMGSCVGDDIDDLQKQINDLNEQVTELEETQQAALEAQITALMAEITTLQNENASQDADYAALLAQLEATQKEVADNAAAVYYGNVISDDEYAAFVESGASIVTGRVEISSQENTDDLSILETIGGSLTIKGGTNVIIPLLKTVTGNIVLEGMVDTDASVDMPMLTIAGSNYHINENPGLVSAKTEALTFVAGNLNIELGIDYVSNLAELELGGADVLGNVYVSKVNGGDIELGEIAGDFIMFKNVISNLVITSSKIGGDFSISFTSGDFATIAFDNLTTVGGDFSFSTNQWDPTGSGSGEQGVTSLNGVFNSLTTVGGNFSIEANQYMTTLDDFNNVITIGVNLGQYDTANVKVEANGQMINVLNGLETVMGYNQNITFIGTADFVTGFQSLTTPVAKKMNITASIGVQQAAHSEGGGGIGIGLKSVGSKEVVFKAFEAVTSVNNLSVSMANVCESTSYTAGQAVGGTATITAFTALTEIGNYFELDFSAEESVINFTGLNALTTIKPYNFNDKYFYMKFNVGVQGLTANIDAFNMLDEVKLIVIDHQAQGNDSQSVINFVNGLPTLASGAKFKYVCMNIYGANQYPRAVTEGALHTLLNDAFVGGNSTAANVELWNRFGKLTDDAALSDDDYDLHYNAIFASI